MAKLRINLKTRHFLIPWILEYLIFFCYSDPFILSILVVQFFQKKLMLKFDTPFIKKAYCSTLTGFFMFCFQIFRKRRNMWIPNIPSNMTQPNADHRENSTFTGWESKAFWWKLKRRPIVEDECPIKKIELFTEVHKPCYRVDMAIQVVGERDGQIFALKSFVTIIYKVNNNLKFQTCLFNSSSHK